MKKIEVKPYLFEDKLLISLSSEWINLFSGIPKFTVRIVNNQLILSSQFMKRR